ncbi:MAG: hypothetical protein RR330_05040 [Alistipes sp.]
MKLTGRTLKKRLYGMTILPGRLTRARYFRGHGVHSPFVYAIVRQVFMKRKFISDDHLLYESLLDLHITTHRAMQLQNLYTHCGYTTFGINQVACGLCVVTRELSADAVYALVRAAAMDGTTLAVMSPYDGAERAAMCRNIIVGHASTTVDNRAYLLIFNNNLPKQHFRI